MIARSQRGSIGGHGRTPRRQAHEEQVVDASRPRLDGEQQRRRSAAHLTAQLGLDAHGHNGHQLLPAAKSSTNHARSSRRAEEQRAHAQVEDDDYADEDDEDGHIAQSSVNRRWKTSTWTYFYGISFSGYCSPVGSIVFKNGKTRLVMFFV